MHGATVKIIIIIIFCFYVLFVAVIQIPILDNPVPSYSSVNEFHDLRHTVNK
jgi:hypothetical protein